MTDKANRKFYTKKVNTAFTSKKKNKKKHSHVCGERKRILRPTTRYIAGDTHFTFEYDRRLINNFYQILLIKRSIGVYRRLTVTGKYSCGL